jgi:hypothetical protein
MIETTRGLPSERSWIASPMVVEAPVTVGVAPTIGSPTGSLMRTRTYHWYANRMMPAGTPKRA